MADRRRCGHCGRGLGTDKQVGRLVVDQGWGFIPLVLALVAISFAIVRMCGRLSLTAAILGVVTSRSSGS
jgi:hypothetical protein